MFIKRQKTRSKSLVQEPCVQKNFCLSSRTLVQFNVMSRTYKSILTLIFIEKQFFDD